MLDRSADVGRDRSALLQLKEASPSVPEPYGSPLPNGRHFYLRQLRDAKIKPLIETFDAEI